MSERYGAGPEEWAHFDLGLGLTEDLLPVVSDPTAMISDHSKMKALGKTPSRFNGGDYVAGIANWTSQRSAGRDVERWAKDDRLGICIQTRHVRALDIDVDHKQAEEITIAFEAALGVSLPGRHRLNSFKMLLAFRLDGEHPKRSFKTEHGLVEFLGNGQQFVAIGTHPSGARYVWSDPTPEFPLVSLSRFERAWAAIVERFATEQPYEAGTRKRGIDFHATDTTAEYLVDSGLVLAEGRDGQLFVECPWKEGHSGDSGVTEACWFPAGTSGYDQGHFKCLHASCSKRSDDEFREAVGCGTSSDFETLPAMREVLSETPAASDALVSPPFQRDTKGQPEAIVNNVMAALEDPEWFGAEIAYDEFRDEVIFTPFGKNEWRPIQDTDLTLMRRRFDQRGFKPVGPELMRSSLHAVARKNRFDSAKRWLNSLKWDGTPRVGDFLAGYFGAEASDYVTGVSRYWWTAHAARILYPGCRCDMVPILVSPEGRYKSAGLTAMVPHLDQFVEIDLEHKDADLSRKMRGALLGELAELRGLSGRGAEANKAWVTRRFEEWTPKYIENKLRFMRRLVFVGTINETSFLDEATGARRWLPVRVGQGDRVAIRRDQAQLWAEARDAVAERMADPLRTEEDAADWEAAYLLGEEAREAFTRVDGWQVSIARWAERYGSEGVADDEEHAKFCTLEDILLEAVGISPAKASKSDQMRCAQILTSLGFSSKRLQVHGVRAVMWGKNA
jgi:predicted P-loop ATPase